MECIVCVVSLLYFQWAEGYGVYCVFYFQWAEGYGVYCVFYFQWAEGYGEETAST